MDKKLIEIENFLIKIVEQAGENVKESFYKKNYRILPKKNTDDPLTSADINSENFLIEKISKKFPGYNILSEELGFAHSNSEFTFIIDPLDGTKEFMRGIPDFNIVAGLKYKDEMVLGVIYNPMTNEMYGARINNGTYLNNKRIYVSKTSNLSKSYIYTIFPLNITSQEKVKKIWKNYSTLTREVYRIRGMGNTSSAFCLMAKGSFEGYVNPIGFIKGQWDFLPAFFMLKEAGGKITLFNGCDLKEESNLTSGIVASNGLVHKDLLGIFNN